MEIPVKCHAVNVDPKLILYVLSTITYLSDSRPCALSVTTDILSPTSPVSTPTHDQQRLVRRLVSRLRRAVARVSYL